MTAPGVIERNVTGQSVAKRRQRLIGVEIVAAHAVLTRSAPVCARKLDQGQDGAIPEYSEYCLVSFLVNRLGARLVNFWRAATHTHNETN